MEYIVGYFLADGSFRSHVNSDGSCQNVSGHSKAVFDTKDHDFAMNIVEEYGDGWYKDRTRKPRDVECAITSFSLSREVSDYIRSCQNGYKSFKDWYLTLDEAQQDNFIHGFFDGDGTICLRPNKSGKNQVYVGFTISDPEVLSIVEKYLNDRSLHYSISSDNRGAWVRNVYIGRSVDVLDLMLRWNKHHFLTRKDEKFIEAVKTARCWVQVTSDTESIISSDMQWLCEHFNIKRGVMSNMLAGVNRRTNLKFKYVSADEVMYMLENRVYNEEVSIRINSHMVEVNNG